MVLNCVAYKCNNVHDANKAISFHTFPFKRPDILKLWIQAVRREDWKPSKTSRLCGEHFLLPDYLDIPGSKRKVLKPDAVPSVFHFPKHLKKITKPRKEPTRRAMTSDIEPMELDSDLPSTSATASKTFVDAEAQTDKRFTLKFTFKKKSKDIATKNQKKRYKNFKYDRRNPKNF